MSEHDHYHHEGGEHHHHHEDGEHHHHHHHHEGEHHHDENQHHSESTNGSSNGDNGYVVVPPTPQSSVDNGGNQVSSSSVDKVLDFLTTSPDEIQRMLSDISSSTEAKLNTTETIRAEADSSSSSVEKQQPPPAPSKKEETKSSKTSTATCSNSNATFLCPYYLMAMDRLSKVQIPPKVKDLLLWKNPKLTGSIFGSLFVLLISIAWFSLLTVVSAIFLTALTLIGSYRFYLALIYRIKGTYDNTFDKLSSQDISLPKDKVQNLAHLLETDFNRVLNQLKSILLWDNITTSGIAYIGFYVVYCIGCMFNTVTLLILALVSSFTLPKVYDVYKKPIDQGIEKATGLVHQTVKQIMTKVPMLNKKKTQ